MLFSPSHLALGLAVNRSPKKKLALSFSFLAMVALLNLTLGSSAHSLRHTIETLLSPSSDLGFSDILWQIRIPRLTAAALAGAALAAAGVVSQGLFRNPIASPSILGTEAGGNLAAAIAISIGLTELSSLAVPAAAFLGCLVVSLLLLVIVARQRRGSNEFLLLLGFAIASLAGAMTSLVITLQSSDYRKIPMLLHWAMGSFSAADWGRILWSSVPATLGGGLALFLAKRLDVLVLGEEIATTLGVSLKSLRAVAICGISLLVAAAIGFGGAIPFVGLIVPHFSRSAYGPRHQPLLLASALHGATLTLAADLVARMAIAPEEIPVGVITAMLGAPFFLWLLVDQSRRQS